MAAIVRGDGVAGRCCAHLLARTGTPVRLTSVNRPPIPVILLGTQSQRLIEDGLGLVHALESFPRIRKRIVSWGSLDPVAVEHSAVVVSEDQLLHLLGAPKSACALTVFWTVFASKPLPDGVAEHAFGSRIATAAPVALAAAAEPEACWMESLDEGWLFLITTAPGRGWLIEVSNGADTLLGRSRLIQPLIAGRGEPGPPIPCSPRIADPLAVSISGGGWLACGSAATAFDPICGDGTGHAVRESILASALIRAALKGEDANLLTAHYQNRLTAGFLKHLMHCAEFYSRPEGAWWRSQNAALKRGIEWCGGRLGEHVRFRYRLNGLQLEPLP